MNRYSRQRSELLSGRTDLPGMGGHVPSGRRNDGADANAEQTAHLFEQQNNDHLGHLHGQITALKNLSIGIGDEVRDQNRFLSGMNRDMDGAGNLVSLGTTTARASPGT